MNPETKDKIMDEYRAFLKGRFDQATIDGLCWQLEQILTAQEGEYLGRPKEYWLDLERYAVEQEYPAGYFDKEGGE